VNHRLNTNTHTHTHNIFVSHTPLLMRTTEDNLCFCSLFMMCPIVSVAFPVIFLQQTQLVLVRQRSHFMRCLYYFQFTICNCRKFCQTMAESVVGSNRKRNKNVSNNCQICSDFDANCNSFDTNSTIYECVDDSYNNYYSPTSVILRMSEIENNNRNSQHNDMLTSSSTGSAHTTMSSLSPQSNKTDVIAVQTRCVSFVSLFIHFFLSIISES
jgi:hypothetical protein